MIPTISADHKREMSLTPAVDAKDGSAQSNDFADWASNLGTIVGMVALVLSVLGLTLSSGRKKVAITQQLLSSHWDNSTYRGLTIAHQEVPITNGYLFSVRVYIWASGDTAVQGDDVVVPIKIMAPKDSRFLEWAPVVLPPPDSGMKIAITNDSKEIAFTWAQLASREGATLDVLLTGRATSYVTATGRIRDTGIVSAGSQQDPWLNWPFWTDVVWIDLAGGVAAVVAVLWVFIATVNMLGDLWRYILRRQRARPLRRRIVMLVLAVSFAGIVSLWTISLRPPWPPINLLK